MIFLDSNLEEVLKIRAILLVIGMVMLGCGALRAQIASSPGTGRALPESAEVYFGGGCHTGPFFNSQEPPSLAFLARHLTSRRG